MHTTAEPTPPRRWDPCVLQLLRGALLSKVSPLRILRFDGDSLRLVVSALRSARARHLDWTRHGFFPDRGRVYFPPPLVKGRDLMVDYFTAQASYSIEWIMYRLWLNLKDWAIENAFYDPMDVDEDIVAAAGDRMGNLDQQALVQSLGDLLEPFHVNMLPIVMGSFNSLPDKCKRYSTIIEQCWPPYDRHSIGYLTIQEGYVEPGVSQRRPGLHIDSPRYYKVGEDSVYDFSELKPRGFGFGSSGPSRQGGVFQVSSVPDTCRVWDCIVQDPGEIVGPLGNLEHLRHDLDSGPPRGVTANDPNSYGARRRPSLLPPTRRNGENLAACRLTWMTDRTPQESLPVPRRLFRQYFCLVTSSVTAWYEAHSTRNDECKIVPPFGVEIVRGDMFRAPGVERHSDPDAPAEFL